MELNVVSKTTANMLVDQGMQAVTDFEKTLLYQNTILPWKIKINNFLLKFNEVTKKYAVANNLLEQMQKSLDPDQSERGTKITLSRSAYLKRTKELKDFMMVLKEGHQLLLDFRQTLTGQTIQTDFIIEVNGKTYLTNEQALIHNLDFTLSRFGAGTVSNPFSLAYVLDNNIENILQTLVEQDEAEIISETDIWHRIQELKRPYLNKKSKLTGRNYPNIFYDSKDAEIYTLYQGNPPGGGLSLKGLTLQRYSNLRASLGGGGGYASPFFKTGDIGSTQVKFFKITNDKKNTTVNFARFSLIRDRLQELANILNLTSQQEMGNELLKFFTEKKEHLSNQITISTNAEAKRMIKELFELK